MLLSVRNSGIPLRPWQVVLAEWGHLVWRGMYQPQAERCPSRRSWIRSPHHPPQPRDQLEWCRVFLYAENSCIVRVITQIAKYSIRFFFFFNIQNSHLHVLKKARISFSQPFLCPHLSCFCGPAIRGPREQLLHITIYLLVAKSLTF